MTASESKPIVAEVYPPSELEAYSDVLLSAFGSDSTRSILVRPNPTLIRAEGGPDLPDAVRFLLEPQTAEHLLAYLVALYGAKRVADSVGQFFDAIAAEAGKDTYEKLKQALTSVFRREIEMKPERASYDRLWTALRMDLSGAILEVVFTFTAECATQPSIWSDLVVEDAFQTLGSAVLPVFAELIDILGPDEIRARAQFQMAPEISRWGLYVFKTVRANASNRTFNVLIDFTSSGACHTFFYKTFQDDPDRALPVSALDALAALKQRITGSA